MFILIENMNSNEILFFAFELIQETPGGHKKKIIAVGSDFESSPSPEETPSPPSSSRKHPGFDYHHEGGFGDRNEKEQIFVNQTPVGKPASKSQSFNNGAKPNEIDDDTSRNSTEKLTLSQKHKKLVGSKFKNSLSKYLLYSFQHV